MLRRRDADGDGIGLGAIRRCALPPATTQEKRDNDAR
jgi:hypothetical protein